MRIIDMHCDTIMALMNTNKSLRESDNMVDLLKMKKGDYLLQSFAMFVPYKSKENNYSPFEYCHKMIDRYYQELDANKDIIAPVFTSQDIKENIKNNKMSALLTIEEGGVCLGNIEFLRNFYRLGVRMMTLTWNFKNEIATPNIDYSSYASENFKKENIVLKANMNDGLTDFGIAVVKEMNRLGMVIDCSHLSDKGFYDVIKYSTKQIVCSHSCARSLCDHPRNLTDDMLLKLKENGGVIGINYAPSFVKKDADFVYIKDIVEHIKYIANLIGIDYVGLGSDFDGISNQKLELKNASMMNQLIECLKINGFSDEDIEKISYKNVMRVFEANF